MTTSIRSWQGWEAQRHLLMMAVWANLTPTRSGQRVRGGGGVATAGIMCTYVPHLPPHPPVVAGDRTDMLRAAHAQRGQSPASTSNEPVLGAAQRKHPSNMARPKPRLGQARRHHATAGVRSSGPHPTGAGAGTLAGARAAVAYRGRVEMVALDAGGDDGQGHDGV